jgi:hypothetical protein
MQTYKAVTMAYVWMSGKWIQAKQFYPLANGSPRGQILQNQPVFVPEWEYMLGTSLILFKNNQTCKE